MLTSGIVLRYLGDIFNKKYGNIVKHYLHYLYSKSYSSQEKKDFNLKMDTSVESNRSTKKVGINCVVFSVKHLIGCTIFDVDPLLLFFNMYSSIPIKNTSKADISSRLLSYAKKNLSIVRV